MSDRLLIRVLLDHGADPVLRDHLAVEAAIASKDLSLVKMLVESDTPVSEVTSLEPPKKRRKVGDRVEVTPRLAEMAMKAGAQDIVRYFVHDKGECCYNSATSS